MAAVTLAFLLVTGAAGCAQEADESPLAAPDGTQDAPGASDGDRGGNGDRDGNGDGPEAGSLDWEPCGGTTECAELDVPVDYDAPDGDTLTVSVTRVPAGGDRIGALFVNPGGPGSPAGDFAARLAPQLPRSLTEHFDIVGVDPRGLGASDIDCGADFTELYGVDYSIDSPGDEETLLEVSEEYVEGCEEDAGELLAHLGTADVARDIDAVRAAMGDDQLNYLGYSYGTAIGQMLAELFPDRVRAMVIDGIVDLGPTGIELAVDQAAGFENALDRFVTDCDDDGTCPIGPDSGEAIDTLIEAVEEEPIPASPRDLGPGELALGLAQPLYADFLWPELADAVDEALDGDGSAMVALADDYMTGSDFDIYFAVNCLDFAWPDTAEELLAEGAEAAEEAPRFGEWIVNDYVRCAMWPAEEEPLEAVTAADAPPVVVVGTTNDPATPYAAAEATAERLESATLLTYEGDGHGVVGTGVSSCIDDAVVDYLVDLDVPEDGTTC